MFPWIIRYMRFAMENEGSQRKLGDKYLIVKRLL